ncbi:MAG: ABC transporter permease [Bacillota bacterium]
MDLLWQGIEQSLRLLFHGDREVLGITLLTLKVSGLASLVSTLIGIPLGLFLAFHVFPGRKIALSLIYTGMGMPPVVAGLWVSLFLWRSGPLGFLNLLYTPTAMVIAQSIIAIPVVTALSVAAMQQVNPKLRLQITALGATSTQTLWTMLKEARLGLFAAVIAGFGAVISEVGAAMMVGGNIRYQTRVLTTATVMEVSRGHFDLAIALSVVLIVLAYAVTLGLTLLQQRGVGK